MSVVLRLDACDCSNYHLPTGECCECDLACICHDPALFGNALAEAEE